MVQKLMVLVALVICSYEDLKNKSIHTSWLLILAAAGILWRLFAGQWQLAGILSAMVPGFFVWLLSIITKGSIGEGDGMMLMIIGIILGGSCAFRIFLYALFLSGGYALFLFVIRKKSRKHEMAFVPFMLVAFTGEILLSSC